MARPVAIDVRATGVPATGVRATGVVMTRAVATSVVMTRAVMAIVALVPLLGGCGSVICAVRITRASDELARAEQLDATRRAPFEFHFALEHLREARSEAMEADYGAAARLAAVAHTYARRAVERAQRVERVQPSIGSSEESP